MFTRIACWTAGVIVVVVIASPMVSNGQGQTPSRMVRGQVVRPLTCLHDARSVPDDRVRREQAQAVARAVNQAQGQAAAATRRYQPLAKLPNLPPVPRGFELRFYTDGEGYILSLKDTFDPCRYGVFTDQHGRLYEMSPQVPQIAG